jgi:hypothetical protein
MGVNTKKVAKFQGGEISGRRNFRAAKFQGGEISGRPWHFRRRDNV